MKINKAKLLVGTLAVAAVAATVGSISGTVAWFQYSTRSTVAYSGAAAHVSENLQIRLYKHYDAIEESGESGQPGYVAPVEAWNNETEWKSDLSISDVQGFIKKERGNVADYNLRPVTSGAALSAEGKVATTFYKSPIYQYSSTYDKWESYDALDVVELPIELRVLDRNGKTTDEYLAKKVYLSDLKIEAKANDSKKDITPALRVSFDSTNDVTFSKEGGEVTTTGTLDLNADGNPDQTEGYEWDNLTDFVYGTASSKEVTSQIKQSTSTVKTYLADDADPKKIIGNELGSTTADNVLKVTVRIYLEGWHQLDKETITGTATEFATKADMLAAHLDGENEFTAQPNTNYKLTDGTFWKLNANSDDFVQVTAAKGAIWDDDDYVESMFNVGMRFSAEAHTDHAA